MEYQGQTLIRLKQESLGNKAGSTALIDQLIPTQPGIIPQFTGTLIYARFWAATVFVDHYSDYFYSQLIRGVSSGETLHSKKAYDCLPVTHGTRVYAYRSYKEIFLYPLFKDTFQTYGQ